MNGNELKNLLRLVRESALGVEEAADLIRESSYKNLGFARIDNQRGQRLGRPEVLFCQGKTAGQVRDIVNYMLTRGTNILATRATREIFQEVSKVCLDAEYNEAAATITVKRINVDVPDGYIAVVTAGTSDIPVAEEAAVTAEFLGNRVERIIDVGVAGIHRLFDTIETIRSARVVIVVAGMEGALPSVVGGLVDKPVIAVPTSVGYGASFGGVAALLAMLNSCSGGVAVVNIDNGFGAGCVASAINRLK
ncbi:MAG: nickel pincer cofactor biosynthesis protein LarB [Syntrophales bacterium]|nr:nickel pincer cofactor biosynthesis protein LarB [Syntrophales bacterium]